MPASIASIGMRRANRDPRRYRLLGGADAVGRSLYRAAEWVSDGVDRLRREHAEILQGVAPGLSTHVALAGAVEMASLAVDLTANPVAATVVALGSQALTFGIATDAAMRVARRQGVDGERARTVLALAIEHAERRALCATYEADAWRMACGLPRAPAEPGTPTRAVCSLVRDGTRAVVLAAIVRAVPKSAIEHVRWAPAVFRIARLPKTLFAGARLVAAVEGHARLLCGPPANLQNEGRGRSSGATPARAASTVDPLFTIAARPGVIRPRAPSPIAMAFGAMTRPRPRRTLAIA
jgi:hypothetical protein